MHRFRTASVTAPASISRNPHLALAPSRVRVAPGRLSLLAFVGATTAEIAYLEDTPVEGVGYVCWVAPGKQKRGIMADQEDTLGGAPRSDGLGEVVFEELRTNFRG